MTVSRRSSRRRAAWAVPVLTVLAVGGAVAAPLAASAGGPSLAPITPEALLVAVQGSQVRALSGTVTETAALGLPSLPGTGGGTALSLQTLLMGTNTAKVAVDGPDRQRVALLGTLAESDVVHDGTDLWTYSSDTQKVTHEELPAEADGAPTAPAMAVTPVGAADDLLKAITPSTVVTVTGTTTVAHRDAYTLVLTPKDAGSTVREVAIAVDSTTFVPLRVQVFGASSTPAFQTGFTSISFATPSASTFVFTPPKGSTVTTGTPLGTAGGGSDRTDPADGPDATPTTVATGAPRTIGSGWTTVLETPAGSVDLSQLTGGGSTSRHGSQAGLVGRLFTTLPNGDRLLQTSMVNALLTADGRLLVGAVAPAVLEQDAATS